MTQFKRQAAKLRLAAVQIISKEPTVTVTTLDPKSALIVVDLQQGIVSLPIERSA